MRNGGGRLLDQFDERKVQSTIDGNEHVRLTPPGAQFGNVEVEVADRLALECLLRWPLTIDIRQADAPMMFPAES